MLRKGAQIDRGMTRQQVEIDHRFKTDSGQNSRRSIRYSVPGCGKKNSGIILKLLLEFDCKAGEALSEA